MLILFVIIVCVMCVCMDTEWAHLGSDHVRRSEKSFVELLLSFNLTQVLRTELRSGFCRKHLHPLVLPATLVLSLLLREKTQTKQWRVYLAQNGQERVNFSSQFQVIVHLYREFKAGT